MSTAISTNDPSELGFCCLSLVTGNDAPFAESELDFQGQLAAGLVLTAEGKLRLHTVMLLTDDGSFQRNHPALIGLLRGAGVRIVQSNPEDTETFNIGSYDENLGPIHNPASNTLDPYMGCSKACRNLTAMLVRYRHDKIAGFDRLGATHPALRFDCHTLATALDTVLTDAIKSLPSFSRFEGGTLVPRPAASDDPQKDARLATLFEAWATGCLASAAAGNAPPGRNLGPEFVRYRELLGEEFGQKTTSEAEPEVSLTPGLSANPPTGWQRLTGFLGGGNSSSQG